MKSPKPLRMAVTTALLLVIGVVILQALGYGIGFFFDPEAGVVEFASPPPAEGDALTVALVGLVGAGMLGAAAILAFAAVLIFRGNPAGAYLTMAVGGVYLLAGLSALRAGWTWDGYFYMGSGGILLLLSVLWRAFIIRESKR